MIKVIEYLNQNPNIAEMAEPHYITKRFCPIYYTDEIWVDIHPSISDKYMVSNKGRVYSKKNNCMLAQNPNHKGYMMVHITTKDGKETAIGVHRLVKMSFDPVDNMEYLTVDHVDTNKLNNNLYNLDWCTNEENIARAYDSGIKGRGEDHMWSKLTEEQVRIICEGLVKELPYKVIAENAGLEYNNGLRGTITLIRKGENWKHISKDYNIVNIPNLSKAILTSAQIHDVCRCLEQNMNNNDIIYVLKLDKQFTTPKEIEAVKRTINRIRNKQRYTIISDNYNF